MIDLLLLNIWLTKHWMASDYIAQTYQKYFDSASQISILNLPYTDTNQLQYPCTSYLFYLVPCGFKIEFLKETTTF